MARGYVATWRNVGNGAALLGAYNRGAIASSEQITNGIQGIGNAFTEAGQRQGEVATSDAEKALMAAAPEDREALLTQLALDKQVNGKALFDISSKLTSQDMANETLSLNRQDVEHDNTLGDKKYESSQNQLVVSNKFNQEKENRIAKAQGLKNERTQAELDDIALGNEFLKNMNSGKNKGGISSLPEAKGVLTPERYAQYATGIKDQVIAKAEGGSPPSTKKAQAKLRDAAIAQSAAAGEPASSQTTINNMYNEHYGISNSPADNRAADVATAKEDVSTAIVKMQQKGDGSEFDVDNIYNAIASAATASEVKIGNISRQQLPAIQAAVASKYSGTMDEMQKESTNLLTSVSDSNISFKQRGENLIKFGQKLKGIATTVNGIQKRFGLSEKEAQEMLSTFENQEGLETMYKALRDAKVDLRGRIDKAATDKVDDLEKGAKLRAKWEKENTPQKGSERFAKAYKDIGWDESDTKAYYAIIKRGVKNGAPRELMVKAMENIAYYTTDGFDGLTIDGSIKGEKIYDAVFIEADNIRRANDLSYPTDDKPPAPPKASAQTKQEYMAVADSIRAKKTKANISEFQKALRPKETSIKMPSGLMSGASTKFVKRTKINPLVNSGVKLEKQINKVGAGNIPSETKKILISGIKNNKYYKTSGWLGAKYDGNIKANKRILKILGAAK